MAHNEIRVQGPPSTVFDVLADPRSFARWVVGSNKIKSADPDWPADGTAFDHAVGFRPLTLSDTTTVRHSEEPERMELLVRARPFVRALVSLRMTSTADGTLVEMDERAADARSKIFLNRLTDPLIQRRNAESLRRLKALAEGSEPIPDGELPPRDVAAQGSVRGSSRPAKP